MVHIYLTPNTPVTVYVVAGLVGYALFAAWWPPPGLHQPRYRPIVHAAVAVAIAVGLAGFQLVPWVRLAAVTGRSEGLDWETVTEASLGVRHLVAVVFPEALGTLRQWEGLLFVTVGLVAFVPLAWWAERRRRPVCFLLLLSLAALAFAAGSNLPVYGLHHLLLPQLRIPARLAFFWSVGIATLGAVGLDWFLRSARAGELARRPWVAYLPALVPLAVMVMLGISREAVDPIGLTTVLGTPLWLAVFQVGTLCAVCVTAQRSRPRVAGVLIVGLIATEGLVFARPYVTFDTAILQVPDVVRAVGRLGPARVTSLCEDRISSSALGIDGVMSTGGFSAVSLPLYTRYLGLVRDGTVARPYGRLGADSSPLLRRDLLDFLNVSHLIACRPLPEPRFRLVDGVAGMSLYENLQVRPRAFLSCDSEPRPADLVARRLETEMYDAEGALRPLPPGVAIRPPRINIRWVPGTGADDRRAREARYQLGYPNETDDARTWQYDLLDSSAANRTALVGDAAIEDTHGIDHASGLLSPRPDPLTIETTGLRGRSLLMDASTCDVRGRVTMHSADQPDGSMRMIVETPTGGTVFLSEPWFVERRAWVDGREQPLERANLAFSAVRVGPGRHVVELRFVPTSLYWGVAMTLATALCWLVAVRWRPRRPHPSSRGKSPSAVDRR